jgi:hypothetical protein
VAVGIGVLVGIGVAVGGGGVGVPQACAMVMGRLLLAFRGLIVIFFWLLQSEELFVTGVSISPSFFFIWQFVSKDKTKLNEVPTDAVGAKEK